MGDASHQQTCVMCFVAIICSALNTELGCCCAGGFFTKMPNSKTYPTSWTENCAIGHSLLCLFQAYNVPIELEIMVVGAFGSF